jgi:hypothetical protein
MGSSIGVTRRKTVTAEEYDARFRCIFRKILEIIKNFCGMWGFRMRMALRGWPGHRDKAGCLGMGLSYSLAAGTPV